jgi:acylphosphatase
VNAVAFLVVAHGRVQGVGYRDAAVQAAFDHRVFGWVRNRADGTVEMMVQGPPADVDAFLAWCRRGPPLARVGEVTAVPTAPDPELDAFLWRDTV